jgi:UV DNA damage endonuclease
MLTLWHKYGILPVRKLIIGDENMKNNRLGLICLLSSQTNKKGFAGITSAKKSKNIHEICRVATIENIKSTLDTLHYCHEHNIRLNRITSDLIPFCELWDWRNDTVVLEGLSNIKKLALYYDITLTIHPSQFVVISSVNDEVVKNSIDNLTYHKDLSLLCGIQHIILHIGSNQPEAVERWIYNYNRLDSTLKALLNLEVCHSHDLETILYVNSKCNVNVVYDAHHQRLHNNNINKDTHIDNIRRVMKVNNKQTICHISSGKSKPTDKSHADYISKEDWEVFKYVFSKFDNLLIEVEAKAKEKNWSLFV